jgi:hypothetical protein
MNETKKKSRTQRIPKNRALNEDQKDFEKMLQEWGDKYIGETNKKAKKDWLMVFVKPLVTLILTAVFAYLGFTKAEPMVIILIDKTIKSVHKNDSNKPISEERRKENLPIVYQQPPDKELNIDSFRRYGLIIENGVNQSDDISRIILSKPDLFYLPVDTTDYLNSRDVSYFFDIKDTKRNKNEILKEVENIFNRGGLQTKKIRFSKGNKIVLNFNNKG